MAIEELYDIAEELADKLGIYSEERSHWTSEFERRIRAALATEAALSVNYVSREEMERLQREHPFPPCPTASEPERTPPTEREHSPECDEYALDNCSTECPCWCHSWNATAPPAQGAPGTREAQSDSECICKGNWRSIVAKSEPLLGKNFTDSQGQQWCLFGIVHADDDFYYGMASKGKLKLLSCVGSIEGHGYALAQPGAPTKER